MPGCTMYQTHDHTRIHQLQLKQSPQWIKEQEPLSGYSGDHPQLRQLTDGILQRFTVMAFEVGEYPPMNFREKYKCYLAPQGYLLPPHVVFGKNKNLGSTAEVAIRKAFKITMKKLKKMRSSCAACGKKEGVSLGCEGCGAVRYCCEECQSSRLTSHALVCHHLKEELLDQVVECLPSPLTPTPDILRGRGGVVKDWRDWFCNHTTLAPAFTQKTPVIRMWWEYTGLPIPEAPEVEASLWRIYSNAFTTPITIGLCATWFPGLTTSTSTSSTSIKSKEEFHIHLLGADEPEVRAVQEGIIQSHRAAVERLFSLGKDINRAKRSSLSDENFNMVMFMKGNMLQNLIASRIIGRPLVVTLVAPDLVQHPQTLTWSHSSPHRCGDVKAIAYPGLYHHYWEDHIVSDKTKTRRPDVALAIHPGVHTDAMMALWQPTLLLLARERVPLAMTTYNLTEYDETVEKLAPLGFNMIRQGKNTLGSLHIKQTPYEPDHVWAANSFLIAIDNRTSDGQEGSGVLE
ncbi:putative protein MSS51, mitochondrial [Chionoecetes opilio]|uniref:MYND-type domain-containing protein n=1 Tax=Chionoecetes opilio TaxID=41210 RepID=A0A8J4Y6H3_CHIOP|nr:putative protein MSS51, mitochondrial [Chionoecetes opilio]